MNIFSKAASLSFASILLMGATLNASGGNAAVEGTSKDGDSQPQAEFQQFLQSAKRANRSPRIGKAAITTRCELDMVECLAVSSADVFACIMDFLTDGAMTPVCVDLMEESGGVCARMVVSCGLGVGTPSTLPTIRLARAGSGIIQAGIDVSVQRNCTAPHRVKAIAPQYSNFAAPGSAPRYLITKINMTCTDGAVLSFGYSGAQTSTFTCAKGYAMSGVLLRTGNFIDAVGGTCRKVSPYTNPPTTSGGPYGGTTGGSRTDRLCGSRHVVGAKVYMDGAAETGRNLLGIEVLCR
ncbi:MAG: hypothetical protein V4673_04845 [Pseudomonadota bacterium]